MRKRFKALRASVPADAARAAERAVADSGPRFLMRLTEGAGLAPAQAPVALYFSLPGELGSAPLIGALAALGFPTLLPCAGAKATPLAFRVWRPGDPLVAGRFGLSEPAPDAPEIVPKIVLAPLLAFDAFGGRLGFGGGYYDVTLAKLRAQNLVAAGGLAFARQQAAKLVLEKHDAALDFVITEEGILNFMDGGCGFSSSAT